MSHLPSDIPFNLHRDALGQLVFTDRDGNQHAGVVPVRAFPITAPGASVSIVSVDGGELAWIEDPQTLDDSLRALIDEELASREFIPEIRRVKSVSSFATPSTWTLETDRGETCLVLRSEDDIRRLTPPALLIADAHGIHFLIRDRTALDAHSRKLLDRFL
ncbi:DUF1854 domain-containing protein [Rhodocyclus tenuis]|uniref:DUF1854 domain-containing protein n=2 Tax=Rhodocyclus TaxID=1064 RepID=A0A6L5JZ20_RHOTE|nr:DUF1854 domain-containing protein [Rhodocyclus gracilis]MQY52072.1 DUF1854 domain-containing protein [Rhodocyclus gracilis]MRD73689.1 DUF1854 domain-containing protein [Rhodocyclus gracilis]NJA89667.1 DUF1854 domain-containing protein [Rhodocyclus gracilis]